MEKKIFIQTNDKQLFGAKLAKYAIEKNLKKGSIPVEILNVNNIKAFKDFNGTPFTQHGETRIFDLNDLQSFIYSRFMPPEQMGYEGRSIVIDPDIFALTDLNDLFDMDYSGKAILCCKKGDENVKIWDSSLMVLDNAKLKHWKISQILSDLRDRKTDHRTLLRLIKETSVGELPDIWNDLDELTPETRLLHTTERLTQPWKTGLPIDFTRNKMPKLFGFIPREWIHKITGKYPSKYQRHPDKKIEEFFFNLAGEALLAGVVSVSEIQDEMDKNHVRKDMLKILKERGFIKS